MDTETQQRSPSRLSRLAGLAATAVLGAGLTWLFCQDYVWKISHPSGGRDLFGEPGSLVGITVLEFAVLAVFIGRAAIGAGGIGALWWVILLLFVVNIVLTIAIFGVPAY